MASTSKSSTATGKRGEKRKQDVTLDTEMEILRVLEDSDEDDDLNELLSSSDESEVEQMDIDSDESDAPEPQRPRRVPVHLRAVRSLDSALDPTNYDRWEVPAEPKEHTVVMEKKTRDNPEQTITWKNQPPTQRGRQNTANIISGTPGVNRTARNARSPLDAWNCMFTDDMKNIVVTRTNEKIQEFRSKLNPEILTDNKITYLHETNVLEITALIGLIYARGLLGQNHHRRDLLFSEKVGHPIFGATMSKNRFVFLLSKISFDEESTRRERWQHDRFAAFRDFHTIFNRNCAKAVTPDDFITLDETLYPMRTSISFKQYNKSKPAKYGLLLKSINAARYPYTFLSKPYSGKPAGEPTEDYVVGTEAVVRDMMEQLGRHGDLRGRNLSVDRFYTSVPLAEWLFQKGVTIVGTLQANRKGIAKDMKKTDGRPELSYEVHWSDRNKHMSIHSYVVKTKSSGPRNVLLLTTMKPILAITKDDGKKKPAIYKLYDFTKGGTDIVDQRAESYTCKAKSNRWTLVGFYYVLDICRINASTIMAMNERTDPRKTDSFEFGWSLAEALTRPFITQRPTKGLAITIKKKIHTMLGEPEQRPEVEVPHPAVGERHRCRMCLEESHGDGHKKKKKNLAKMRTQCQQCGNTTCKEHSIAMCVACYQKEDDD